MNTTLITYATPAFTYAQAQLIRSAGRYNIQACIAFNERTFASTEFYKKNKHITLQSSGAGYWLWKPYYIWETLKNLKENELLIYCDAGVNIITSVQALQHIAAGTPSGIVLFENYQGASYYPVTRGLQPNEYNLYTEVNKNKYWTRRDAFILMDADNERYWNAPQVDGSFQVYRKCDASLKFVEEWLSFCCNEQILTDLPDKCGQPGFENAFAHRHDQSVISVLAERYNVELYRCPSQFGNHYKKHEFREDNEYLILPYSMTPKLNSPYPTLLDHHRSRRGDFGFRMKQYAKNEWEIWKAKRFLRKRYG